MNLMKKVKRRTLIFKYFHIVVKTFILVYYCCCRLLNEPYEQHPAVAEFKVKLQPAVS